MEEKVQTQRLDEIISKYRETNSIIADYNRFATLKKSLINDVMAREVIDQDFVERDHRAFMKTWPEKRQKLIGKIQTGRYIFAGKEGKALDEKKLREGDKRYDALKEYFSLNPYFEILEREIGDFTRGNPTYLFIEDSDYDSIKVSPGVDAYLKRIKYTNAKIGKVLGELLGTDVSKLQGYLLKPGEGVDVAIKNIRNANIEYWTRDTQRIIDQISRRKAEERKKKSQIEAEEKLEPVAVKQPISSKLADIGMERLKSRIGGLNLAIQQTPASAPKVKATQTASGPSSN